MDKIDKKVIDLISAQPKFDGRFVGILKQQEHVSAIVRVHNPLHLGMLERRFHVTNLFPFIRSVGITCNLEDAIKLERMQEVEYVSAQGKVTALDVDGKEKNGVSDIDTYRFDAEDALSNVGVVKPEINVLSQELDGEGVTMCVMDTGISLHSDLSVPKERIVYFVDMINGETLPYDDNGHGTFVSGVACGNGLLSAGHICGVAPKSNLVGIKVISKSGESGAFKILDGMQWLFDNYRQYGIRVVCMSFGADPQDFADPLKVGAEMLARSGLIVVAACGNSGVDGIKSPAISPEVISVGAVSDDDKIAPFSSRGSYNGVVRPDVYARGVDVKGISAGGTYSYMSGTSAAAPYVAGACCLICQQYKNITPRQAKNLIISNSVNVGGNRILKL